ncbi:MAG: hypothetical protein CR980_02230 [Propionibacteriales bacterium]|nr:MAG: hypothetical protein CR980_02230 [Propionibacteriales bacterium]
MPLLAGSGLGKQNQGRWCELGRGNADERQPGIVKFGGRFDVRRYPTQGQQRRHVNEGKQHPVVGFVELLPIAQLAQRPFQPQLFAAGVPGEGIADGGD